MEMTANEKLVGFLNGLREDFVKVQVNKGLDFQQEAFFATQILTKNDYTMRIARGNTTSLANAVINVATIGLSLNPTIGLAYLVPRKNEICLDISYLGLVKLAQDSGAIKDVKAELVFEKDHFQINGAFNEPTHTYSPFGERGKLVGGYVVARTPDNSFLTTVMTIDEILEIRNASESYKNEKTRSYSPWSKFEGEMIKKTIIRRAYKMWPKTNRSQLLEKAIQVSDEAQAIEFKSDFQEMQDDIDRISPIPPEEKELGAPTYRIQNAKYRGLQLKDIDAEELVDYMELLSKRHEKHTPKSWELDVKESIRMYLESFEMEAQELVGRF